MILHNIPGVTPAEQADGNLQDKLNFTREVKPWKEKAHKAWLDCKRRTWKTALRNFIRDNDVDQYLIHCPDQTPNYRDDSIPIYFTFKE